MDSATLLTFLNGIQYLLKQNDTYSPSLAFLKLTNLLNTKLRDYYATTSIHQYIEAQRIWELNRPKVLEQHGLISTNQEFGGGTTSVHQTKWLRRLIVIAWLTMLIIIVFRTNQQMQERQQNDDIFVSAVLKKKFVPYCPKCKKLLVLCGRIGQREAEMISFDGMIRDDLLSDYNSDENDTKTGLLKFDCAEEFNKALSDLPASARLEAKLGSRIIEIYCCDSHGEISVRAVPGSSSHIYSLCNKCNSATSVVDEINKQPITKCLYCQNVQPLSLNDDRRRQLNVFKENSPRLHIYQSPLFDQQESNRFYSSSSESPSFSGGLSSGSGAGIEY